MPGPTTEVLNDDLKELKAEVHRIDVSLAELRTEVKDAIGIGKWAATLVVGLLITIGGGGLVTGVWWASKITSKVEAIEARFDKLEASIARVIEQTKPTAK